MGGGGEGVEMTPTGYEPPLELPDGCHHISLEKFLEVNCCVHVFFFFFFAMPERTSTDFFFVLVFFFLDW